MKLGECAGRCGEARRRGRRFTFESRRFGNIGRVPIIGGDDNFFSVAIDQLPQIQHVFAGGKSMDRIGQLMHNTIARLPAIGCEMTAANGIVMSQAGHREEFFLSGLDIDSNPARKAITYGKLCVRYECIKIINY
jgi:hypothetical protein